MGVGRFFCVALPFALTIASLICLLIGGLAGVTNTGLFVFRVNTTDLSINPVSVSSLLDEATSSLKQRSNAGDRAVWHGLQTRDTASDAASALTSNITAADLGLADLYDVSLWGYCSTSQSGNRTCTKAKFDWASNSLNTSSITSVGTSAGVNITLPSELTTALNAFKQVTKWTEVVFIIAYVALALEIFFGIFATCSRGFSCVTWIISGLATFFTIAAASMATAMAAVVVGAVDGTAKYYGVDASINTSFLAVVWLAAAFAIGAGLFWLFTVCCCKPEHRASRGSKRHLDDGAHEKFIPAGSYQPLHEPAGNNAGYYNQQQYGVARHQSGAPRSDLAYEPYSHSRV